MDCAFQVLLPAIELSVADFGTSMVDTAERMAAEQHSLQYLSKMLGEDLQVVAVVVVSTFGNLRVQWFVVILEVLLVEDVEFRPLFPMLHLLKYSWQKMSRL